MVKERGIHGGQRPTSRSNRQGDGQGREQFQDVPCVGRGTWEPSQKKTTATCGWVHANIYICSKKTLKGGFWIVHGISRKYSSLVVAEVRRWILKVVQIVNSRLVPALCFQSSRNAEIQSKNGKLYCVKYDAICFRLAPIFMWHTVQSPFHFTACQQVDDMGVFLLLRYLPHDKMAWYCHKIIRHVETTRSNLFAVTAKVCYGNSPCSLTIYSNLQALKPNPCIKQRALTNIDSLSCTYNTTVGPYSSNLTVWPAERRNACRLLCSRSQLLIEARATRHAQFL